VHSSLSRRVGPWKVRFWEGIIVRCLTLRTQLYCGFASCNKSPYIPESLYCPSKLLGVRGKLEHFIK
jgi:hypothetical protein